MTIEIKVSTAHTFLLGPFVDKDDGVAVETGLATAMDNASTGIRLSKNGGNMADRNDSTAPVHDEDGWYTIVLDATDTNTLGLLQVEYTEVATALPAWKDFSVVTANYWDTKYSTDQFDVNITNIIGTAPTLTSTNIDVNVATMDANSIATGVIAIDAIGITAMAPNSIASDVMAANSIAVGVIATDAIGTAAMAPNSIATDVMAAGSISAGTIASGELTNIENEIWDALKSAHVVANSFGDFLDIEVSGRLASADINLTAGVLDEVAALTGHTAQTADHTAGIADIPTVSEFDARTILSADYFDPTADAVANVTLCATTTAVTNDVGITATAVNLIWDEAMTETTGAPAITASFREALKWMFALSRNKILQTATLTTLRNDADGGDLATSVVADDAVTYTRNEWSV